MNHRPVHDYPSIPDEIERRGALVLRTLPILLIPIVVTTITFALIRIALGDQFGPPDGRPDRPPFGPLVPIVVLVVFFSALIILVRLGRPTISALIAVWTLLTTLGTLRSGVTSSFPALLIIPICVAGLDVQSRAEAVAIALQRRLVPMRGEQP